MSRSTLKSIVGLYLIFAHVAIIMGVFWLSRSYLAFDDAIGVVFIVAPVFAAHTTMVVREFVRTAGVRQRRQHISGPFAAISLLFPIAFTVGAAFLLFGYAEGTIETPKALKGGFGALEVAFGTYLGIIVDSLFRDSKGAHSTDEESRPRSRRKNV
jgi:hypothetical protein